MFVTDDDLALLAESFPGFKELVLLCCEGFGTSGIALVANKCRKLRVLALIESEVADDEAKVNHQTLARISTLNRFDVVDLTEDGTDDVEGLHVTAAYAANLLSNEPATWLNCVFLKIVAAKSGVEPSSVVELARHVNMHCPNLVFSGLMTIGMSDYTSSPENFRTLTNCRAEVCKALGMSEEQFELSMGMSGDFEHLKI
ncbi:unnamed protein product [Eruca vesicaria subsp. sativa]|uniref:Uncharacterized protein n=1 Tax=Eruca vesicaria subsp. sativa TaxID=29727 RepID=A0ABC8IUR6_ERUVS|nr:unnamed protein product [Eruca vesicaria subsp. sativa]